MDREKAILELKRRINKKLKKKLKKRLKAAKNYTPPRYDDVYWEGIEWLNRYG